jgi:flagellar secretion chaperone FliS
MSDGPINPYLRTKILTASPEELRLMLLDGAIKFCRQGAAALSHKKWEASYEALIRAQKIALELSTSMKPELAPELCERLTALYTYIYRRLVDANLGRDESPVQECLKLLEYERETWVQAMKRLASEKEGGVEGAGTAEVKNPIGRLGADSQQARQTMLGSLSVEG